MLICRAASSVNLAFFNAVSYSTSQQNRTEIRLQIDRDPGNRAELGHEVLVLVLQEIAVEHRTQKVNTDVQRPRAEVTRIQFVVRTAAMSARGVAKSGIDAVGELAIYALNSIGVINIDIAIEWRGFRWWRDRAWASWASELVDDSRGDRRTC